MQRFERGSGGNPHHHGFNVGHGNPRLGIMLPEQPQEESAEDVPISSNRAGLECDLEATVAGQCLDPELEVVLARAVEPPPAPHPSERPARVLKRRPTAEIARQATSAATKLLEDVAATPSLEEKEQEFWKFFRRRVSEWNPCFTEEGEQRVSFHWDAELAAHDVEVAFADGVDSHEPARTRLSEILAEVLGHGTDSAEAGAGRSSGERGGSKPGEAGSREEDAA